MQQSRLLAREFLRKVDGNHGYSLNLDGTSPPVSLKELWLDIRSNDMPKTAAKICENLLVAEAFFKAWKPKPLQEEDVEAGSALISWTAMAVLPSSVFAGAWEEVQLGGDKTSADDSRYDIDRLKSTVGVSVLQYLDVTFPIHEVEDAVDIVTALATFTVENDPWTTKIAFEKASGILDAYESHIRSKNGALAGILGGILQRNLKPLFSKTKNPAITAAGRKNVHPVPQPRFDSSIFDSESKPWKFKAVYSTTVLTWIINRYLPSDQALIEAQFPLLVPPVLSLIDDDSLAFKARGCVLLSRLLIPLEQTKSDILRRTNLASVFEDALSPCLHSLPTITPEDQSVHLLGSAYPALLSVIRTRFPSQSTSKRSTKLSVSHREEEQESQVRLDFLTRVLRHNILPSYHHISSPVDTTISSYPHPRLSALLLKQLTLIISGLGIQTTKHLQDLIPVLFSTLTNPFGTAYLPLLSAATESMRHVVLKGWPRIWRWRGDVLAATCGCWLNLCDDEEEIRRNMISENAAALENLKLGLKELAAILKIAVAENADQETVDGKHIDIDAEYRLLVSGDERLQDLLFAY